MPGGSRARCLASSILITGVVLGGACNTSPEPTPIAGLDAGGDASSADGATPAADAAAGDGSPLPGDAAPPAPDGGADDRPFRDDGDPDRPLSSAELIDEARRDGRLAPGQGAVLDLLAALSPGRVPQAYAGAGPRGLLSVSALAVAAHHRAALSADDRAVVDALTREPGEPGYRIFPAAYSRRLGQTPGLKLGCFTQFEDEDARASTAVRMAPIDTTYLRIYAVLPEWTAEADRLAFRGRVEAALNANVPGIKGAGTVTLAAYLDQVFVYYRDELKLADPRPGIPDLATKHAGRVPVYIANCDGREEDAGAYASHIVAGAGVALEDPDVRRIALPHELLHVFEFGYLREEKSEDLGWPYEAAAVAVEDLIAPDVRRWSGQTPSGPGKGVTAVEKMDRYWKCPEEEIHSSYAGRCRNRPFRGTPKYRGDYSRFVVFKSLERSYGAATAYRTFWEAYGKNGDPAEGLKALTVVPGAASELSNTSYLARLGARALMSDVDGADVLGRGFRESFDKLDFRTRNVARYTFVVEASRFAQHAGWRLAPPNVVASTIPDILDTSKVTGKNGALQPGGTHRWLIELPPEARTADVDLRFTVKLPRPSSVWLDVYGLGAENGEPARKTDFGSSGGWAWDPVGAPNTPDYAHFQIDSRYITAGTPYLLVIVHSAEKQAIDYQAGITIVNKCVKDCREHFAKRFADLKCCHNECCVIDAQESPDERAECDSRCQASVDDRSAFAFCGAYCGPDVSLARTRSHPDTPMWRRTLPDGVPLATPTGLIPIDQWAPLTCAEMGREDNSASCR